MSKTTKIGLISLGCAKNLVDSEHMLSRLRAAGYAVTVHMEEAEIAIINTCGFIEAAKKEAISTILETAQYKQSGVLRGLIVTGCLAQRYRAEIEDELPEVDAVLGTGSYDDIVMAVGDVLAGKKAAYFADITAAALEGSRDRLTPAYTAYLKIAEGCSNRCGYCIIPKLRGPYRSRNFEALLAEARGLAESGVKELIVIAQDITRYGMDLYGERRLPALLRELCRLDFTWVRLHYLYPDQITDELTRVIADEPKIVKYLDIPLQHVSRRILRSMHRPGDRASMTALLDSLRERIPGLVLRTSLIVGGTKQARRLIVEELQSGVMDDFNFSRLHETLDVLCEGWDNEQELYFGRSYADSIEVDGTVYFSSEAPVGAGEFVRVRIDDSLGADLAGTRVG